MDRLWAPWRIKYIQAIKKEKKCIFCKKNIKKLKANFIVKKKKYCFSMLNIYPYNNGHLLVAPYRHISDFALITNEEILEMNDVIKESIAVLKKVLKPAGFNIGVNLGAVSGAGVCEHIHFHIVPRWNGDTNYMSVVSSTKVISESLNDLYVKLRKEYSKKGL